MRRVHLVRHGRTEWNAQKKVMGWLDHDIHATWRPAAERVADELGSQEPVVLCTSPLRRARSTGEPLARRLGLPLEVDDRFGEHRVGPWEGLAEVEIAERWPDEWRCWREKPQLLELDGRETLGALYTRVGDALDDLAARLPDGGVAVVFTHDAVVRAAVSWALGCGPEVYRRVQVDNCSITTIDATAERAQLVAANDTCHLRGLDLWWSDPPVDADGRGDGAAEQR